MRQGDLVYFQQQQFEEQHRPSLSFIETINSYFQGKSQSHSYKPRESGLQRQEMLGYFLQIAQEDVCKVRKESFGQVYQKFIYKDKCLKIYSQECLQIYLNQVSVLQKLAYSYPLKFKFKHDLRLVKYEAVGLQSLFSQLFSFQKKKLKEGQTGVLIEQKKDYRALMQKDKFGLLKLIQQAVNLLETFQKKIIFFNFNLQSLFLNQGKLRSYNFQAALSCNYINLHDLKVGSFSFPNLKHRSDWLTIPQYLAPQVLQWMANGAQIDFFQYPSAIDIFSLGCSLIQLLAKKPLWLPFKVIKKQKIGGKGRLSIGRNPVDILKIQKQQLQKSIAELKVPQKLRELLRRMTQPRRESRANCSWIKMSLKSLYS